MILGELMLWILGVIERGPGPDHYLLNVGGKETQQTLHCGGTFDHNSVTSQTLHCGGTFDHNSLLSWTGSVIVNWNFDLFAFELSPARLQSLRD